MKIILFSLMLLSFSAKATEYIDSAITDINRALNSCNSKHERVFLSNIYQEVVQYKETGDLNKLNEVLKKFLPYVSGKSSCGGYFEKYRIWNFLASYYPEKTEKIISQVVTDATWVSNRTMGLRSACSVADWIPDASLEALRQCRTRGFLNCIVTSTSPAVSHGDQCYATATFAGTWYEISPKTLNNFMTVERAEMILIEKGFLQNGQLDLSARNAEDVEVVRAYKIYINSLK